MTVITNAELILKDSKGNIGTVKTFTDNDIAKISNAIADIGKLVNPVSHLPIKATATTVGVVQLADDEAIAAGTTGRVVDAKQLQDALLGVSPANCVTNVAAGSTANKIKVTKDGYTTTIEIDNVEHAGSADEATHASQADTAAAANSVAWDNVRGKPTKVSQFTNDSNYLTGITKAMVTNALGYTPPTSDTNTWNALKGSTTSAAGTAGYAPAPAAGEANRYLRCDGTWQVPPDNNTTYSVATTSANGLMSSSDKTKLNKCVTTDSIWVG